MIAALYVETGGVYYGLPDVDPWDEARDARRYAGPWPVVAHPPCARWCSLAPMVERRYGYKQGDDGGCFGAALAAVRTWGGVLEHPAKSTAWRVFDLPRPLAGGWQRGLCGGWVCQVEQFWYGHRARKSTWLYAHGVRWMPSLRWGAAEAGAGEVKMCTMHGGGGRGPSGDTRKEMPKRERSRTPPSFRDVLLEIARSAA